MDNLTGVLLDGEIAEGKLTTLALATFG